MLEEVRSGGKRAVAEALVKIETSLGDPSTIALLDEAHDAQLGFSLGVTGPPGVGKSTLLNELIRAWRGSNRTVAVIAIDPSSSRTRGALLGDRTRFSTDPADAGVFVRSMAARDMLGGVAAETFPGMTLMRAIYDLVIVETVGVGQSETAVSSIVDLTMFCAQPGSGDALQYMKAGIMEVPDLIAVTKSDMGDIAIRTATDLKGSLSLTSEGNLPAVVLCSAASGEGVPELMQQITDKAVHNSPRFGESRNAKLIRWLESRLNARFGSFGAELVHSLCGQNPARFSFRNGFEREARLNEAFTEAFL